MAEIVTQEIAYNAGDTEMIGFLAWDDAIEGPRPGVLVVHEWWGQNDYSRRRAQMLAELGYTALALDMYGDGKSADHPDGAGAFMRESLANLPQARERFNMALELLRAQPTVDPGNIAAIGYCYGGGVVLHMARYGADLKAVASFHGSLGLGIAPDGEGGEVTARIAVYNGEDDPLVSADEVAALAAELETAGADFQIINFPGAVHSFTNPGADQKAEQFGMPLGYNALADESSWDHMQLVFAKAFSD
jgi:dienelactone hydrolase